jgi:hypothetical protein
MRVFVAVASFLLALNGPVFAQDYSMSEVRQHYSEMIPFLRSSAQENLRDAGFYSSSIDGAWGPATEAAYEALAREDAFSEHMRKRARGSAAEELANFPFSGPFAGAFLGLPYYELGDECPTCDFAEDVAPAD